jgi:hypothetical protein
MLMKDAVFKKTPPDLEGNLLRKHRESSFLFAI